MSRVENTHKWLDVFQEGTNSSDSTRFGSVNTKNKEVSKIVNARIYFSYLTLTP